MALYEVPALVAFGAVVVIFVGHLIASGSAKEQAGGYLHKLETYSSLPGHWYKSSPNAKIQARVIEINPNDPESSLDSDSAFDPELDNERTVADKIVILESKVPHSSRSKYQALGAKGLIIVEDGRTPKFPTMKHPAAFKDIPLVYVKRKVADKIKMDGEASFVLVKGTCNETYAEIYHATMMVVCIGAMTIIFMFSHENRPSSVWSYFQGR